MPNSNYDNDLRQIRERLMASLEMIDKIKERYDGDELDEIECIREQNTRTLSEVDEIRKRRNDNHQAVVEAGKSGTASSD